MTGWADWATTRNADATGGAMVGTRMGATLFALLCSHLRDSSDSFDCVDRRRRGSCSKRSLRRVVEASTGLNEFLFWLNMTVNYDLIPSLFGVTSSYLVSIQSCKMGWISLFSGYYTVCLVISRREVRIESFYNCFCTWFILHISFYYRTYLYVLRFPSIG